MLNTNHFSGLRQFVQQNSKMMRKSALMVASVFLIVGLVYSYSLQPQVLQDLKWQPIALLVFVGVPLTMGLNAVEFIFLARLNQIKMPWLQAVEITVIGSAANMLPLPGATIVRVTALKGAGSSIARGTSSTIAVGVIWMAVAFGYAGLWMLSVDTPYVSFTFIAIGVLVLAGSIAWWRMLNGSFRIFVCIFVTKVLMVFIDSARIYLCFASLGVIASFSQVSGLAVSSVLGSAVSIVPAGLGIREGVSAALSPVVGLAAAVGFMAAFINRLLGLAVLAPMATYLSLRKA